MYVPDLSPYTGTPSGRPSWWERLLGRLSEVPLVSVGWLRPEQPGFPTGPTPAGLRAALVRLARNPARRTRGWHVCPFCQAKYPVVVDVPGEPGEQVVLGTAEIHVPGAAVIYASPTLIVHYIDEHRYLPPREFCDAVEALGSPTA